MMEHQKIRFNEKEDGHGKKPQYSLRDGICQGTLLPGTEPSVPRISGWKIFIAWTEPVIRYLKGIAVGSRH